MGPSFRTLLWDTLVGQVTLVNKEGELAEQAAVLLDFLEKLHALCEEVCYKLRTLSLQPSVQPVATQTKLKPLAADAAPNACEANLCIHAVVLEYCRPMKR